MSSRLLVPLAAFAVAVSVALAAPDAHAALSKRDQAAVDALQARMETAEKRYRNALLGEDDEAAIAQANAAMAEIKAAIEACGKQRGCQVVPMLERYEALLKATTLEEAGELLITMNDLIIEDRAVIPLVNRAADVYAIANQLYQENVALGVGFEYNYWNIANWNLKPE